MALAAILEGATLVGFLVVMAGGKQARVSGWRILAGMLLVVGAVEGAAMAIAVGLPVLEHWRLKRFDGEG
jgi:uncharacterized membrane protein YsdA (DUF1294 family)